jgi:fructose-1,6-bisphosphatase/inositol monophosphatase family enzyme
VDTQQISQILKEVAQEFILPRFDAGADVQEITEKTGPGDVVTIADREAEEQLISRLRGFTPDALVIGEESVFAAPQTLQALPTAPSAWVVDALDGTLNFTRGNSDFAVMLAQVRTGEVIRGWIYQPISENTWEAERGAGVALNGEQVVKAQPSGRALLGATYIPFRREPGLPPQVKRSWGSCGIDYPKLIQGEVDFLAYRSMFPWDHLPGGLMVAELGGLIATEDGQPYRPGSMGRRIMAAMSAQTWQKADELLAHW